MHHTLRNWRHHPELRLLGLALPLELAWEGAQLPLYTLWREHDWGYILFSLAHCTAGDLLILLACHILVALLARNRFWFYGQILLTGTVFTLSGMAYTIYSEIANAGPTGSWEYTEQMPVIPLLDIGMTPLLQWLLIPPVLLWLMRRPAK